MSDPGDPEPGPHAPRPRRSDAEANVRRILRATAQLLGSGEAAPSAERIARQAGVSRATVYRHFVTREAVLAEAREQTRRLADANEEDRLRPAGELGGGPTPFDVADVLNKVPPSLLGDQVVAEARRLAGVAAVALYLVDISGSTLRRHIGPEDFPTELPAPGAVGPELPREAIDELRAQTAERLPGTAVAPLLLRGRAVGVLVATGGSADGLEGLARQAAASLGLAEVYTDAFGATRRRWETSPAAEMQQNLLPPRIARIAGATLAGNIMPSYDIGGDWFDYVENGDGAWIGVADSIGAGPRAAALGGVSLGAFRAKRRAGGDLAEVAATIDQTLCSLEVGEQGAATHVTLARWHGPSALLEWVTCGDQAPIVVHPGGELERLADGRHEKLGIGPRRRPFVPAQRRLAPGERVLLVSNGVLERPLADGSPLGLDGLRAGLAAAGTSAPATVEAIERTVREASTTPLHDDATAVVLVPSAA